MKQMEAQAALKGRKIFSDEITNRVLGIKSRRIIELRHGPKAMGFASQKHRNYELEEALKETNNNNDMLLKQLKATEAERQR